MVRMQCVANTIIEVKSVPGMDNCTMNVHLLQHLENDVRLHGPLWTHSAFEFESINGHLVRMIHGTHDVQLQVNRSIIELVLVYRNNISIGCHGMAFSYYTSVIC